MGVGAPIVARGTAVADACRAELEPVGVDLRMLGETCTEEMLGFQRSRLHFEDVSNVDEVRSRTFTTAEGRRKLRKCNGIREKDSDKSGYANLSVFAQVLLWQLLLNHQWPRRVRAPRLVQLSRASSPRRTLIFIPLRTSSSAAASFARSPGL